MLVVVNLEGLNRRKAGGCVSRCCPHPLVEGDTARPDYGRKEWDRVQCARIGRGEAQNGVM